MNKIIFSLMILFFTISCSTTKKDNEIKEEINVNDCLYFYKQKLFVIDERLDEFLLYSELNHMKFVFVEKKEKVNKFGIKVKCPKSMKEKVFSFLENHY